MRRLYTPGSPVYHTDEPAVYMQDDWHARSWLTVNLGLRYDIFGPLTEDDDHLSNWDPVARKLLVAGTNGVSKSANVKTDFTDVSPRLGFSATLPHKMVLRGGWGLSYFPNNKNSGAYMKNPPFTANYGPITSNANSNLPPNMFLKDGLPPVVFSSPLTPAGNVIGTALDYKSDRAKQFDEKHFDDAGAIDFDSLTVNGTACSWARTTTSRRPPRAACRRGVRSSRSIRTFRAPRCCRIWASRPITRRRLSSRAATRTASR